MTPARDPLYLAALVFLRTIDNLRLPVLDNYVTLEQLREAAGANDESWPVSIIERERWVRHALVRFQQGAIEYSNRSFSKTVVELLEELSEEAADLGAWGAIAHHALSSRDDLDDDERELVGQALRDAVLAGAQAWARIDQAKLLLASIDERRGQQR